MNTVLKPLGISTSTRNASSGPVAAPTLSSMRWTPNDLARCSGWAASEISASRGAVRMPFPILSPVTIPAMVQKPPAKRNPILATMERPYPATATRLGCPVRSETHPAAIRTMALAPWLMPSMIPNAMVDSPRKPVTYSGRMAATDSDEISVIMLTIPSQMITGDSRNAVAAAAGISDWESFWPPVRSDIERYKGCLVPADGLGRGSRLQAVRRFLWPQSANGIHIAEPQNPQTFASPLPAAVPGPRLADRAGVGGAVHELLAADRGINSDGGTAAGRAGLPARRRSGSGRSSRRRR